MEFYDKVKGCGQTIGSAGALLQNSFLMIGGLDEILINSNGLRNRYNHASVVLRNKAYVFGGCITNELNNKKMLETSGDIVVIDKSIFGIQASVHSNNSAVSLQGLTSNLIGGNLDKAVLFGGFESKAGNDKKAFASDVLIFSGEFNLTLKAVEIDKTGTPESRPVNRAFHASAVSGASNQLLVVFGGQSETGTLLNDLWILDLTDIINAEDNKDVPVAVVDPKAKAPKATGKDKVDPNAPKGPFAAWTRIALGEASPVSPRYMHSCFVANGNGNESFKFFAFGGIASSGPQPLSDVFELTVGKNTATGKYTLDGPDFTLLPKKPLKAHADNADNFTSFCAVTVPIGANFGADPNSVESGSSPVMVLVIDGSREFSTKSKQQQTRVTDSNSYMLVMDETSRLVRRVRKAVLSNNQSSSLHDNIADGSEEAKSSSQVVEFANGDRYEGEVLEGSGAAPRDQDEEVSEVREERGQGVPHGRGVMNYANNDVYEGQWVNGLRHGSGQQTDADGSTYSGSFSEDERSGQGLWTSPEGGRYEGQFQRGAYGGYGELTYGGSGDVYRGAFERGVREGEGNLFTAADKSETTGRWENDQLVGAGQTQGLQIESLNCILSHSTNALLAKGLMSASMAAGRQSIAQEGITSRTAYSKGLYTGPVIDGIPSGEVGSAVYQDGSEYTGAWRSGRRNGLGSYIFPNQDEFVGKWVGDKRCGQGVLRSNLNPGYEGNWSDNLPHGTGTLLFRDGRVFTGEFVGGKRNGEGKLTASVAEGSEGAVLYEGMWVNDCPGSLLAGGRK